MIYFSSESPPSESLSLSGERDFIDLFKNPLILLRVSYKANLLF